MTDKQELIFLAVVILLLVITLCWSEVLRYKALSDAEDQVKEAEGAAASALDALVAANRERDKMVGEIAQRAQKAELEVVRLRGLIREFPDLELNAELFAASKEFLDWWDALGAEHHTGPPQSLHRLRAAIAKAGG